MYLILYFDLASVILYFDLAYVTAVRCVFTREKVKHGFLHPFFPRYLSNVSPKYLEIKSAPHFLAKGISLLDSLERGTRRWIHWKAECGKSENCQNLECGRN